MSSETLVTAIDARLATLIADTTNVGDYEIGGKRVDKGTYMAQLMKMRTDLLNDATPYEDIREIAFDINVFGEDDSEYIGDVSS